MPRKPIGWDGTSGGTMRLASEPLHGFTLTVRELGPGEVIGSDAPAFLSRACEGVPVLDIELRFNRPPTPEWEMIARGILTRASCSKVVEIHGRCESHSPEIRDLIMADALNAALNAVDSLQSANAVQSQPVEAPEKSTNI